jgi:2-polyprenyl-3-methyl-5-hydroxy-6-metoxy-1,4-benzoquinol methylase
MIRFNKFEHKKILISISDFIRKISKGDRLTSISNKVSDLIEKEANHIKRQVSVIDFGCGSMEISKKIQNKKFIKRIIGLDIFHSNFKKKKLSYYQYNDLDTLNKFKSDIVIIIDVLHHIGVEKSCNILKKLSKNSNTLIIKDHFEYGFFSRHLLRFVDFYANYAYGVNIPKKYFNIKTWKKTIKKSNLREIFFEKNFKQHVGLFNLILNKKHHFISVLKK